MENKYLEVDHFLRHKTKVLLEALCEGLYEREEAIKLALLTAIAGESIFLLGPPGVGKSLIARRLKFAFKEGTSFEYLMSKFSTPDEIFGPVSIKKLKEEDKYQRLTDRYLPGANVVFLDEIWKAGPAIQNALLTILNEKIYRNGDEDLHVDIRAIITASNELPPPQQHLAPIWDRFLVRLELGNIKKFKNFLDMIVNTDNVYEDNIVEDKKVTVQELEDWSSQIDQISVPAEVLNTIQLVKYKLDQYNARPNNAGQQILIFDRRWKKIVRLLRTAAFLNGRNQVDLMDCALMVHCLWGHPSQFDLIKEIVSESVRKHGYSLAVNLQMLKKEINVFEEDVNEEIRVKYTITEDHLLLVQEEYYQLDKEETKFEGALISTKQFRALQIGEPTVTNFYDEALNLVNRLKSQKGTVENTLEVFYNSTKFTYPLKTKKVERSETIFKKPHTVVEQFWESRYEKLITYLDQQDEKLDKQAPNELNHLDNNLFVDQSFVEVVKANLEEVSNALKQLRLRLEKIRYAYTSLNQA